jgi:hypothetical protein
MIQAILDALYYCCFRQKQITPETILEHLQELADHEIEFIINKVSKLKNRKLSCC